MEDTNTTGLHLNYTHYGNWSYEGYQESECPDFSGGFIILTVFLLGVSVFGMVGNGIVLWFLGFQMKWNPCTIYVLNLAVADCSVLLLRFLFTLGWFNFKVLCFHLHYFIRLRLKIIEAFHFLCRFFVLSSLGLLTAISTDRCVSVIFPIWYRCHRPKHLSGIVSGVIWACIGSFILSYYLYFEFGERYSTLFASLAFVYSVILSLTMLISNVSMVMRLRRVSQRRPLGKLYVAVALNVIFFFAFGIPHTVAVFQRLSYYIDYFPDNVTLVLELLNSSINPVIYFLVGSCRQRRFQGSIKVALRRVFEEKERSKEESPAPEAIPMESTAQGPGGEGEA